MKNIALVSSLAMIALLQNTADAAVQVKAGVSTATYSTGTNSSEDPIDLDHQALSLGVSYLHANSGVYVDFTMRNSIGSPTWKIPGEDYSPKGERKENTFTIGKVLSKGWVAFAGYQSTTLNANDSGSFPGGTWAFSQDNTLSGLFVGAAKSMPIYKGSLTGSIALANIKADTNEKYNETGPFAFSGTYTNEFKAGLGYSLGATYSQPLTEKLGFFVDLKYQNYKPGKDDSGDEFGEDTLTSFGAGISAKF